jgi:hypothetical protein
MIIHFRICVQGKQVGINLTQAPANMSDESFTSQLPFGQVSKHNSESGRKQL